MDQIEIRLCKTWDECLQCEELQKRIWEMPDYRDVVPANLLITAAKNGGIFVGAFDGGAMVGFAFGFLGSEAKSDGSARRLKHTSHMLGVVPDVRVKGLGAHLKWFQRQVALTQGLDLMTWTYDPLQAVNAHLNLARLGAIARRYYRNAYGDMTDALNAGVASDRFEVEWYLTSARVSEHEHGRATCEGYAEAQKIYRVEWDDDALPMIAKEEAPTGEAVLVEIPADYNALKAMNRALAVQWRERTRQTFERAFELGYVACDAIRKNDRDGRARAFYLLKKGVTGCES